KSKVKLPYIIWISYRKTLSNESQGKINDLKSSRLRILAILDKTNVILRQMSNGANAQKFENAMRDILRTAQHVLAIDAFVNASTLTFLKAYYGENIRVIDNKFQPLIDKTVEYLYDPNSGAKAMRIGYKLLQQGKHVAFVLTSCSMARALVEKASKLPKSDNSHIRASYTSIVEADISFKKTNYFEAVIGITNITTPVNVEAFIQMIFQIRDCKKCILSFYYQKNSSDLFRPPGYENICAELE
ncbi:18009_t:CDS:2, partial [Funneliformis geosporum]